MSSICKNCSDTLTDNFCSHCGQAADTGRINMHFLWEEIQSQIFSFDKGILYTSKELFLRPGASIREYLAGKRVTHIKPIALVILLTGVFSLLYSALDINMLNSEFWTTFSREINKDPSTAKIDLKAFNDFKNNHNDLVELAFLPLYSLATFFVFRKYKYNFAEHLVLNSFITTQKLIVGILMLPLFSYYNHNSFAFDNCFMIETLIGVIITVRIYISFFDRDKKRWAIFKSWLVYMLMFVEYIIVIVIYAIVAVIIMEIKGEL